MQAHNPLKFWQTIVVPRRILKVTKWLSMTPAAAICITCGKEFKVPMIALSRTKDAQANLQAQFDSHQCRLNEPGSVLRAN